MQPSAADGVRGNEMKQIGGVACKTIMTDSDSDNDDDDKKSIRNVSLC